MQNMRNNKGLCALLAALMVVVGMGLVATPLAHAQATISMGSIEGTIFDHNLSVVPNAKVTVTNKATLQESKGTTNGAGKFEFAGLAPGWYRIRIQANGFKTFRDSENVLVGANTTANFVLDLVLPLFPNPVDLALETETTWDKTASELADTGRKASDLVEEIRTSVPGPSSSDLGRLRKSYDKAKENFLAWVEETVNSIESREKTDLPGSQKAKDARASLRSLAEFGEEYAKKQEQDEKNISLLNTPKSSVLIKKTASALKGKTKFIQRASRWWSYPGLGNQNDRREAAQNIRDSGSKWPEFEAIE